ncbi:MAG: DUF805 domain-containing protein [Maricaulis sp.]|jgi:uncharacterized membrane protein YhaH (DUF805 family)|nr:DUF805 domain-containing protein [Maricaulis sp.]
MQMGINMDFMEAVRSALKNWNNFHGRARRSEFWWWYLASILISIAAGFLDGLLGGSFIIVAVVSLGLIVPSIAMFFRRLHDTGRSAWWMLIGFVPLIGLILLYFYILDSDAGDNAYGPSPKPAAPGDQS